MRPRGWGSGLSPRSSVRDPPHTTSTTPHRSMLDPDPAFRPIQRRDGYLPIEDLSLIGDGATCALVGLDGGICWMCVPRFDSEPLFCSLLDRSHGGHFTIAPEEVLEARQRSSAIPVCSSPSCAVRQASSGSLTPLRFTRAPTSPTTSPPTEPSSSAQRSCWRDVFGCGWRSSRAAVVKPEPH